MNRLPFLATVLMLAVATSPAQSDFEQQIGREAGAPRHMRDGDESRVNLRFLLDHGRTLFDAVWTEQEGGGRPLTKGNGNPLSVLNNPLVFPRNFNRVSAPDANSCSGCHNKPFLGGGGDFVASVFVTAQRFDFATLDPADPAGSRDEIGRPVSLDTVGNWRASVGMFGAGYIELLAREMTARLQSIRDRIEPGQAAALAAKGVSFGTLARKADGSWDISGVQGISPLSLATTGGTPPSLIIRPFHQAGAVISLREFTNNAYNHHHGIQPAERFGDGTDPDGDQFTNELTRADVTAVTLYQATLAVPGRVIPNHPAVERAVRTGEIAFEKIGCASCHVPALPLDSGVFAEPGPYNPAGNLQTTAGNTMHVDLGDGRLPGVRLKPNEKGVIMVPAFTDLKLHDICNGPDDPNIEPIDMTAKAGTEAFFSGNRHFLTKKLWGAANEAPFFHHGRYATMREAILAHGGEAAGQRRKFEQLPRYEQDSIIEFLKTLQVLPEGVKDPVVDENFRAKAWPR
ncbi:MAG: thiol oxidoreductase [Acidobacteria bacterium]|nr:thiol oxidoreductase [Acidobacteriota bacterium]